MQTVRTATSAWSEQSFGYMNVAVLNIGPLRRAESSPNPHGTWLTRRLKAAKPHHAHANMSIWWQKYRARE